MDNEDTIIDLNEELQILIEALDDQIIFITVGV